MYDNVKLEKSMHHISGKSFSEVLESLDPTGDYAGTPLANTDAFTRQLKRFDIHLNGRHCDQVEKFFRNTESSVLFPEMVRRAVMSGFETTPLFDLVGLQTHVQDNTFIPAVLRETGDYTQPVAEGEEFPITYYNTGSEVVSLSKYGRCIQSSYESIHAYRLDTFIMTLRVIGMQMASVITKLGVEAANSGCASRMSGAITYENIAELYGNLNIFSTDKILASPANVGKILGLEPMADMGRQTGHVYLPFGAELIKVNDMSNDYIIGMDSRYALQLLTSSDLLLETDKLIDTQFDRIVISFRVAFRTLTGDAICALDVE